MTSVHFFGDQIKFYLHSCYQFKYKPNALKFTANITNNVRTNKIFQCSLF